MVPGLLFIVGEGVGWVNGRMSWGVGVGLVVCWGGVGSVVVRDVGSRPRIVIRGRLSRE